jgi:uroporphyrinogen decarboxylase
MSRRDDFNRTLQHKQPERVILDFGGNPLSSMEGSSMRNLLAYLGYDANSKEDALLFGRVRRIDERILKHFDVDTRSVGTILKPQESLFRKISPAEYIDEWGIHRVFTGQYWDISEHPLKDATMSDLENFHWPDPESVDRAEIQSYADLAERIQKETDYVICAEHPVYGIFELGCWMCGFDDFLYRMAAEKEFVHRFYEIVLEYQKKVIEIYYGALGNLVHYTSSGDDFATQTSLFFSPAMFRELVAPYFSERIAYTKRYTEAAFLHHSCGNVFPIIDDLIKCGVDILNPIQPGSPEMQPANLKASFGDRIVFHGGVDTQQVLPGGTPESIDRAVRDILSVLNKDGGYIFAAAHNIQEDVPPQNVARMLEAARKYGGSNL